jgi:hypothetical protein
MLQFLRDVAIYCLVKLNTKLKYSYKRVKPVCEINIIRVEEEDKIVAENRVMSARI